MFGRNAAKARSARPSKSDTVVRPEEPTPAPPTTLLAIARVEGKFEGNMVATGNVEITATGRVSGNVETDSLVISQGGFFNGNVAKIREHEVHSGPRPVHLVEDKRLGAQK
jgi:hypothetical protein